MHLQLWYKAIPADCSTTDLELLHCSYLELILYKRGEKFYTFIEFYCRYSLATFYSGE